MRIAYCFLTLVLLLFALSCADEPETSTRSQVAPINPNGDTELALLMREMFDDAMRMKTQIQNDEPPKVRKHFTTMLTAEATEPEKAASPEYKTFANTHLALLKALEKAPASEAESVYRSLVESCMSCHRAMCPGPMVRIKKLRLPKAQ